MGNARGALVASAKRIGMSPADYAHRLAGGERWCTACKAWHPAGAFGRDRDRTDGRSRVCGTTHVWRQMLARCRKPQNHAYKYYGGRGIRVCARWESVVSFIADMGPRPSPTYSIDRIDNDGNYEPGNCRWATKREQRANQRRRQTK